MNKNNLLQHFPATVGIVTAIAFFVGYGYDFGYFHLLGARYLDLLTVADYMSSALRGLAFLAVALLISLSGLALSMAHDLRERVKSLSAWMIKKKGAPISIFVILIEVFLFASCFYLAGQGSFHEVVSNRMSRILILAGLVASCFVPLLALLGMFYSQNIYKNAWLLLTSLATLLACFGILACAGVSDAMAEMQAKEPNFKIVFHESGAANKDVIVLRILSSGLIYKMPAKDEVNFVRWDSVARLIQTSRKF